MNPIDFPEKNKVYQKPEGWTDEQCYDLPVHNYVQNLGPGIDGKDILIPQIISCWQLEPAELEELKRNGGKIFIGITAYVQPPIWLSPITPFIKPEENG